MSSDVLGLAAHKQYQEIAAGMAYQRPTKRQELEQKKRTLELVLAKVNAALQALDDYPDLEKFLNVIGDAE